MADISDTLKSILGDDAEDKIKGVMNSLAASDEASVPSGAVTNAADLMQLKSIIEGMTMNRQNPRANLLLSLKPYMREGRQQSIDSAVRLLGIVNILGLLGK